MLGPLLFTLYTANIGKVINKYGLSHHIYRYADDNQLYGCCLPSDSAALRAVMVRCIASVGEWMASNRLMLNPSKYEFIWFASPHRIHLIDRSPLALPDGVVMVYHRLSETSAHFSTKECSCLIMLIILFDHVSTIFIISISSGVR